MKNKIITAVFVLLFTCVKGFSQDTTHLHNQKKSANKNYKAPISQLAQQKKITKKPMYRDTRLGGSSKKYNTYKKNDNGAGAVTNNPNK